MAALALDVAAPDEELSWEAVSPWLEQGGGGGEGGGRDGEVEGRGGGSCLR